ncbi:MAG: putative esterase [Ramlibacter sp.]|jgi:hypothetical protein|nr:putative esterase [Ramlibacter sp.]
MTFMKRTVERLSSALLLLCTAAALAACGGGGGSSDEAVGTVESFRFESARVGTHYPIDVYLPESYATGRRNYPVIYAVEGDARMGAPEFPGTRFENFKAVMQQRKTQAILVSIGRTERRVTDFLMPGAEPYHAFIVQELIPRIDRVYRTDPTQRALTGLSHGGHFVLVAMALEAMAGDVRFSHFLSFETSSGGADSASTLALEQQLADSGRPVPATLFFAGAKIGFTNGPNILSLYERMGARNYAGLTLEHMSFNGTHVSIDVMAFEEALSRYFP